MTSKKKRVLILCPHPERKGGVAYYYRVLKKYFSSNDIEVHYYHTGKRSDSPWLFYRIACSITDLFFFVTTVREYDLVHLNPSLDERSLIRDGIYHFISKRIFKKKTIVFFRGWSLKTESRIDKRYRHVFQLIFNCDCILLLANSFKQKLVSWGYRADMISLETTTVDDSLLDEFDIGKRLRRIDSRHDIQLLFLARIEKEKGVMETIKAFELLSNDYPDIRLVIAGSGSFLNNARRLAEKVSPQKIIFAGYVRGDQKADIYMKSDIFILPTYHSEGMPNSILEAMAMGVPVITRPVAAINEIFVNGKNGFMIKSIEPIDIACSVKRIIDDIGLWKKMALESHGSAVGRFVSSHVTKRLEGNYARILNE